MGDPIYGGDQFWRKSELFGPPFIVSILKSLKNQIFPHELEFNGFCMILSETFEVCTH